LARKQNLIVGIDLGSSKTCALICDPSQNGKPEFLGFGMAESKGWRRGVIVNLEAAGLALKKAIEEAESAAGVPVDVAYASISGPHLKGFTSRGAISMGSRRREVNREDVLRVMQAAQSVSIPADRELIYVEPQQYLLDSQDGIRQPVGMLGTRLEVSVHLMTAAATAAQNVVTVVNRQGVRIADNGLVFAPLAAAEACLTSDEREMGVALLDIGAGSSALVIYHQRAIQHSAVIPVGGDYFTNDIAVGLRTPIPEADRIKRAWGQREETTAPDTTLEIPGIGDRPSTTVTYDVLDQIIEPRSVELMELLQAEIVRSGRERQLTRGLVLCGGGAKLGGLAALAERTFAMPVRIGIPAGIENLDVAIGDPVYGTLVGLISHAVRQRGSRVEAEKGWTEKLWAILAGGN
jgi:cell division protein FtsA